MNKNYIKELEAQKEKAELLSEYYLSQLKTFNSDYDAIGVLNGIITQQIIDIRLYELKHGENDKLNKIKERRSCFELIRSAFNVLITDCRNMQLYLQKAQREIARLHGENNTLKTKIEGLENSFKEL